MAYFKVSGSIYETFGFPLDKKIYDYFAKNNIKLSDYLSDLYKKEDAPNVPEEYDFLQSDENGRGSLYSIWDAFLGSFDGRTTIELYNEEEEVIWESTLDLSSMLWDDMQCEEDKEFVDNIRSSMSEDKCLLTGEITQDYSERLIYLDDEDIEDFDLENLSLGYFITENRVLLSSITYNDTKYDNWTDGDSGYSMDKEYYSWACPKELGIDEKTALNDIIAWATYHEINSKVIPKQPNALKKLQKVEFHGRDLESMPTALPYNFNVLANLNKIEIGGGLLFKIPENISDFSNLEMIDIQENSVTHIPSSIGKTNQLKELIIDSENKIVFADDSTFPSSLVTLAITSEKVINFPQVFDNLKQLNRLDIRARNIDELPETIGQASNITDLTIMSDEIEVLPESLSNLSKLKRLEIYCNNLAKLPDGFDRFSDLTEVEINSDVLDYDTLPENIQKIM